MAFFSWVTLNMATESDLSGHYILGNTWYLIYKIKTLFFTHSICNIITIHFSADFFFLFVGLHLWLVEVPRLGVKSELQLPSYTTATAALDPSSICNLAACGNAVSLTHWVRPGLGPSSSWTLVGFLTCWSTRGT